jgi:hypothetical protein
VRWRWHGPSMQRTESNSRRCLLSWRVEPTQVVVMRRAGM